MHPELLSILILAAVAAFGLVTGIGRVLLARSEGLHRQQRLLQRAGVAAPGGAVHTTREERRGGWHAVALALVPRKAKERQAAQHRLMLAGFRRESDVGTYYLLKYSGAAGVLLGGLALGVVVTVPVHVTLSLAVFALYLPDLALRVLTRRRLARVNLALPDFIDLCNIAMSAGLNWLASIRRVSEEVAHLLPELSREFRFMLDQIQTGMPRTEALQQLAVRNPHPDVQHLVQILVQNERLGSSISASLEDFSRRLYAEREQRMEEKAGKLSAKMALIILPFLLLPFMILLVGEQIAALLRGL